MNKQNRGVNFRVKKYSVGNSFSNNLVPNWKFYLSVHLRFQKHTELANNVNSTIFLVRNVVSLFYLLFYLFYHQALPLDGHPLGLSTLPICTLL